MNRFHRLYECIGQGYVLFYENKNQKIKPLLICIGNVGGVDYCAEITCLMAKLPSTSKLTPTSVFQVKELPEPIPTLDKVQIDPNYNLISYMCRYKNEIFKSIDIENSSGDLKISLSCYTIIFRKIDSGILLFIQGDQRYFHILSL
jgi:hypothetical protein